MISETGGMLRNEADRIVKKAIDAVLPDKAVKEALSGVEFKGRIYIAAVGKAAWQMAKAAVDVLGGRFERGVVLTKYGHVKGQINGIACVEAGHPVPDENSFRGTRLIIDMVSDLAADDTVLFLLSGGGSALFEAPLISGGELADITEKLLACGADIVEMNTIRKRLSGVKGGRFAEICRPARVYAVILSDIIGDPLDMIASGPTCPDSSTCGDANAVVRKYGLDLSAGAAGMLAEETPKELDNVENHVIGSVRRLCEAVAEACAEAGYKPEILTDCMDCEAREAGSFLAAVARTHSDSAKDLAFIAGGETVVHLTGGGKGGRNQELALAAAAGIAGLDNVTVFSFGSDGTDGPTDAAGGYCDGDTKDRLAAAGVDIYEALRDNDAYHALEKTGGLIITGPTGTNVNDAAVVLIKARPLLT